MSNSEDYLDGLLNSISQKKSNVEEALDRDEKNIQAKIADMSSLSPDDDFMDATGISDFKPKKMSHDNLKEAFSESDFLRDFEDELSSDMADDFIAQFEQEIDDEEAAFERGEELPEDKGAEFVRSLMEEEGALDDSYEADNDDGATGSATSDEVGEIEDFSVGFDASLASSGSDEATSSEGELEDTFVTIDDTYLEGGKEKEVKAKKSSEVPEIPASSESNDVPIADEEPQEELGVPGEAEKASSEETAEELEQEAEGAEELLAALGEDSSSDDGDDGSTGDDSDEDFDSTSGEEAKKELADEVANDEEIQNILDGVASIVDGEEGDEQSILPKEYQSDEHDDVDALEVNEDGISLVDENADLDDLLAGEEGMSDIGDLLDADKNDIELDESRDAYEASADAVENISDKDEVIEGGKKVGFLQKLLGIFKKKKKEDDDEAAAELLNVSAGGEIEDTTKENEKILEEMDEEEREAQEKKQKKAEAKAEKQAAKKAAKAEKKAKKDAAKAEKSKKEKKPSALKTMLTDDKSKKIPTKVLVIFVLLVATIVVVIVLLSNLYNTKTSVRTANAYYSAGNYIEAYNTLSGLSGLNDSDKETMNKARMLADLQNKKAEYDTFMQKKDYQNALDALIVAVGRYNENLEDAKEMGINAEYNGIEAMIVGQLMDQFGITDEEAKQLYDVKGRTKYTVTLNEKLKKLGMDNSGSDN